MGYQDGWHGAQMSGIRSLPAGNQGIEVAFTGAHLGSCQPGNDAERCGEPRATTRYLHVVELTLNLDNV
eukprot:scaffold62610_cov53-Phaeocystis_antarctica.AAC.3